MRNVDILKKYNEGEELDFLFFWGHTNHSNTINKTCLSQWYRNKQPIIENTIEYETCEHYMMVKKSLLMNSSDEKTISKMLSTKTPKEVKEMGRLVNNFDSRKWDENKFEIIVNGNYIKFSQDEDLKEFLLSTNDKILVEASPYDKVWGISMRESDKGIRDPNNWKGENLLGYALMEVREKIKQNK